MRHLLVTNDYPPKIGGIQSYLWELWRRLPPQDVTVLTTPHPGDAEFDAAQAYRVVRTKQRWLLPTPALVRQVRALADEVRAEVIVLDPALPLGLIGPHLNRPYMVVAHGAEFVIPSVLPVAKWVLDRVTSHAAGAIASGEYVRDRLAVMKTMASKRIVSISPGVDVKRFRPLDEGTKAEVRKRYGVLPNERLIVGVSRLVPRKGFDRLVRAAAKVSADRSDVQVLIAGTGREARRLQKLVDRLGAPVTMLGRVPDASLPELYAAADIFCMPCHDRWLGLEREGFGIVFVEAAAAGVPSVAGLSGGSGEAVAHEKTGLVVDSPVRASDVASALARLLDDPALRSEMAAAGRRRAEQAFSYDVLAERLAGFLEEFEQPSVA